MSSKICDVQLERSDLITVATLALTRITHPELQPRGSEVAL